MKQITEQVQDTIFSLYFGQKVMFSTLDKDAELIAAMPIAFTPNEFCLLLTPLSKITDEDACSLSKLISRRVGGLNANYDDEILLRVEDEQIIIRYSQNGISDKCVLYTDIMFVREGSGEPMIPASGMIYDFLRSKGYALPYLHWSVDELVQAGVFKLKS